MRQLQTVGRQSGGLVVRGASAGDILEAVVTTRDGRHWARFYAFPDPAEPGRLREYGFVPEPDPTAKKVAWRKETLAGDDAIAAEIGRHVEAAAARDEFSGVVLVARGDRVVYQRAFGLADRSWRIANQVDTKFNLASANKMLTAVAIAQLVEAGRLRLDDTLASVLPDYPNADAARRITIAQLLSHSAGLGMLFDRPAWEPRRRYRTHAELLKVFAAESLLFAPGTRQWYSNEGYVVLGAVIERLSGQGYGDYVRERILRPAGMTATGFYAVDDVVPNLAVGYTRFEDDPLGPGASWTARLVRLRLLRRHDQRPAGARPRRLRPGLGHQRRGRLVHRRKLDGGRAGQLRRPGGQRGLPANDGVFGGGRGEGGAIGAGQVISALWTRARGSRTFDFHACFGNRAGPTGILPECGVEAEGSW